MLAVSTTPVQLLPWSIGIIKVTIGMFMVTVFQVSAVAAMMPSTVWTTVNACTCWSRQGEREKRKHTCKKLNDFIVVYDTHGKAEGINKKRNKSKYFPTCYQPSSAGYGLLLSLPSKHSLLCLGFFLPDFIQVSQNLPKKSRCHLFEFMDRGPDATIYTHIDQYFISLVASLTWGWTFIEYIVPYIFSLFMW